MGVRHELGAQAEARAAQHLESLGYRILARNYRIRQGELDLVARHEGVVCFVEVRFRSGGAHGSPEETIGREKRRRVARAAQHYLTTVLKREDLPCRFDVVALEGDGGDGRITVYRDAFRLDDC